ncbi:ParB N-terminal domain-containing protein [Priestia abyssalis]|uniref:hypothetical protein n=1 Tax=Priestia abyssalis TaxID=1221450 RepID=UPI00195E233B|nr:hypothetical protein [Priestia abyssalis]
MKPKGPVGTEDFILLEQIVIMEGFSNSRPSPEKIQKVANYLKRTGHLDEPITVNRDTKILTDGYTRYIVAERVKMNLIPVAYEK